MAFAWGQALGGLLQGVGQGVIMQAQFNGQRLRDERMAELQAQRDERTQEFTATQNELSRELTVSEAEKGRDLQLELTDRSDKRQAEALAAADSRAMGLVRLQDEIGDENRTEAEQREDQLREDEIRRGNEAAGVSRVQKLEDDAANRAHEKELQAMKDSAENVPPEKAWDLALRMNSETMDGEVLESTTDWKGVAKTLVDLKQGELAESALARAAKDAEAAKPTEETGQGLGPMSWLLGDDEPAAPSAGGGSALAGEGGKGTGGKGSGTAMAGTGPSTETKLDPTTAPPIPRGADGSVNPDRLRQGQMYQLPDGTMVRWTGSGFSPMSVGR